MSDIDERCDKTTVYLSKDLKKRLNHYAIDTEQTMTAIIVKAIEAYLPKQEDKPSK